jgi:DNA polymerase
VNPDVILLFGILSSKTLLKNNDGIMKLRGNWTEIIIEKTAIKALPTLHPAYLLKQPAHKRLVWQDLLNLKQSINN